MDAGRIKDLLLGTGRAGMSDLIKYMDEYGFFTAPCSTSYHLSKEGGLAEHSLNVFTVAEELYHLWELQAVIPEESVTISALLHDIGKMGQFGKANYVPNMLRGRATKANPNPEPYQSDKKPYVGNPELIYVDHECRALSVISKYIDLTEDEQLAILWHNGLYGKFKYDIPGKETPLYLLIHFADMWASRFMEKEDSTDEEI